MSESHLMRAQYSPDSVRRSTSSSQILELRNPGSVLICETPQRFRISEHLDAVVTQSLNYHVGKTDDTHAAVRRFGHLMKTSFDFNTPLHLLQFGTNLTGASIWSRVRYPIGTRRNDRQFGFVGLFADQPVDPAAAFRCPS